MTTELWLWPAILGVLGLVFGSFIATIAIRWPAERSILKGRSECDSCAKPLDWSELVPALSYMAQLGKCRACGAAIQPSHIFTELAGAGVGITAGLIAPGAVGVAGAIFGWLLLSLAVLDLRAFWLPNELTGALAATGLLTGIAGLQPELVERLIGGVGGFLTLLLAASAYRVIRGVDGLGGGDPKMLGAIGLWIGWRLLPVVVLAACVIGLVAALVMKLRGGDVGMKTRMPLGVLLAVAAWGVWVAAVLGDLW